MKPALWIVGLALLLGGTSLLYPWTDWDNATATYIASTMLDGGAPYRDAWNIKAPGVYFAFALSIVLFGKSALGLRLFDLLWQCLTALLLARCSARMYADARAAALTGSAYLLAYYAQNFWTWAQSDGLLSLPLVFAILFLLRALESGRAWDWTFAGAGVGMAALFRPPFGLFGIALLVLAMRQKPRETRDILRRAGALAAGVALPLGACFLYLHAKGALEDFLVTQFVLAPQFASRLHAVVPLSCAWRNLRHPAMIPLYTLAAFALAGTAMARRREGRWTSPTVVCFIWLAIGVLSVVMHGVYFGYDFLPLFAPVALLAAAAISPCREQFVSGGAGARAVLAGGVALLLMMPVVKLSHRVRFTASELRGASAANEWEEAGAYLRARTAPGDRIYVWGNSPVIYLYAGRKSASRYFFPYFLAMPLRAAAFRRTFLDDFQHHAPRYFMLLKESPPDPCTGETLTAAESLRQFPELTALLAADYEVEREAKFYIAYRQKTSPGKN